MKLFPKFLILFFLVALAPLLFLAWRLQGLEEDLRSVSLGLQREQADRAAENVRAYLENTRSILSITSRSPGFLEGDPRVRRAALESLLNNYALFTDASVLDPSGVELYTLGRFRSAGKSRPLRDWASVRESVRRHGSFLDGPELLAGDLPVMWICVPIHQEPGRTGGYLAAHFDLMDLNAKLRGFDLGQGGRVFLSDAGGRVLAGPWKKSPFPTDFRVPEASRDFSGRAGEYVRLDGERVLSVRTQVPDSDWLLHSERPVSDAFQLVNEFRRRIWGALFVAAGMALALCWPVSRSLIHPLRQFEGAVKRMREGRFDASMSIRSGDEVGAIARELRRTQESVEKKVRQSVVGLMAQRIGHEFHNTLKAIRDSLEVIVRHVQGADEVAKKHFLLLEEEIRRGTEYVGEIQSLGRDQPLNLRRANLNDLVEDVLSRLPERPGTALTADLATDLPACPLDQRQVRRALENVLRNAQEALGKEGRIRVRTFGARGFVTVSVEDDGRGIPDEDREKIFEEFHTTKPDGTGLGMGIIRTVMDAHGGSLRLDSRPGRGTTVELAFPAGSANGGGVHA